MSEPTYTIEDIKAAAREAVTPVCEDRDRLRAALLAILDSVDYTSGACLMTEWVGAVLPVVLIDNARKALQR